MTVRVEYEFRDEKEAEVFKNYIGELYIKNKEFLDICPEEEKQVTELFFEKVKNFKYSENNRKLKDETVKEIC